MDTERIYSKSEIRERRLALQQRIALQQRQLDALAKMDEAADELEQVEREMEAQARGETQPDRAAETLHPEPRAIGERVLAILMDHADTWLAVRDVLADMEKRKWVDTDTNHAMQRLRHCLPRLVRSNEHVECDQDDTTFRYRYRSRIEGYALTPVSHANGMAHPALQGEAG